MFGLSRITPKLFNLTLISYNSKTGSVTLIYFYYWVLIISMFEKNFLE